MIAASFTVAVHADFRAVARLSEDDLRGLLGDRAIARALEAVNVLVKDRTQHWASWVEITRHAIGDNRQERFL